MGGINEIYENTQDFIIGVKLGLNYMKDRLNFRRFQVSQ